MNPGPHGPEIWAVLSTEAGFDPRDLILRAWDLPSGPVSSSYKAPDYYMNHYMDLALRDRP